MHKRQVNKAGIDERSNIKQNIKEMRTCVNTQTTGSEGIQNKQYQHVYTKVRGRINPKKTCVQDKNRIKIKVRNELTDNMITKEKDKELTENQCLNKMIKSNAGTE